MAIGSRFGFGGGLALPKGVGGGTVAPVISDLAVVALELTISVTVTSTLYGVLTATSDQPTGAQIKAGTDHLGAAAGFAFNVALEDGVNIDSPFTGVPSGTWYLHVVADNGALSNLLTLGETIIVVTTMSHGMNVLNGAITGNLQNAIGAGTNYPIEDNSGNLYLVYIDASSDVVYIKSTDSGDTWGAPVTVFTGTATALAVWFDRWSGIAAGLIHCAYQDADADDTFYRSIDTENADALGTQSVALAGTSTANGGALSICRARGGNLYIATMIDAGAEGGFVRSTDLSAWSARTTVWEAATQDQIILMPGWAADNQDIMAFYWDADADEISRKLYDDSGNSWGETSIATSMVDVAASGSVYPMFAAAVDITNSQNLLVAWSAADLLNADLRCFKITESAITEVTNVVLDSVDDQGFVAIGIDTDTQDWYVYYGGASTGADTYLTSLTLNYKKSTDDGATWGTETTVLARIGQVQWLAMTPRFATDKTVVLQTSGTYLTVFYERT